MTHQVTQNVGGVEITFETGKLAKLADGAVVVRTGETVALVTAVAAAEPKEGGDFLPLTVEYKEKAAAVGKIPGGYFKREGRPTEKEILTCRLTDRPLRPLFPKGFFNEVQVIAILLSADGENDPDVLVVNAASAALSISDIPWNGPIGAVRVGLVNDQFVINPTHSQRADSVLDLIYVGTEHEILMIEGSADEIPDERFYQSMEFAHGHVKQLIAMQRELASKAGKQKREIKVRVAREDLVNAAREVAGERLYDAITTGGKQARQGKFAALHKEIHSKLQERFPDADELDFKLVMEKLEQKAFRERVIKEGKRADGRGIHDLRPISGEVGLLPRVHGSSLFARGETQALVICTLGPSDEAQQLDAYTGGEEYKRFLLHYHFPPFSVNETGRFSGPGRREIGHGALAERSLLPVLPLEAEFPYAIRVTSEIMESNGSTSMASVCGGTLALMDAGVPIKAPVAGISVGLVQDPEGTVLLTDILGMEDHYGDMDFKVCGTRRGITGFQLDLKLPGLSFELMRKALDQNRDARSKILDIMDGVLTAPRQEISPHAPRIHVMRINPEKIGAVIGPGGKIIRKITDETGVEINIEDSGEVKIYSHSAEACQKAVEYINGIVGDIEVGKIYRGRVRTLKEFGVFVEVMPGKDGMVHISELANFRVNKVEDICKEGDEMWVKCIGVDDKGRVRLSRKAALEEKDGGAPADGQAQGQPQGEGQGQGQPEGQGGGRPRERRERSPHRDRR
ncbi:MAG: polyribonucleotide nucleotidyltransferase [Verrucomicrobiae bacterium]|nr:polyribonucleotide nucleotidyltransferase [Verrucomicrobiae bacterium]